MPDLERLVAGLRCRDVLTLLADYVEGRLPAKTVERVNAHLHGCDHCERFGGEYGALVATLRSRLKVPPPLDPGVEQRLIDRMQDEWGGEDG